MSKVKSNLVRLSVPLASRWYRGKMYCTGIACLKPLDDAFRPLVSTYATLYIDDAFTEVWEVKCVYTYNAQLPREEIVWHEFIATEHHFSIREAVKRCESLAREAYGYAIERGLALALEGRV